jgi:glycosyltransferase involved in cell wall biosynthesis
MMRIGLVIYDSLDTLSGGYLYDRYLVDYLRECGDQVEVLSLPWRGYYRSLLDNVSPSLQRRLEDLRVDVLLQDELCHPSLLSANRDRGGPNPYPVISIVHHLLSSEPDMNPIRQRLRRTVEREYLRRVDGFIFNSLTTRRVVLSSIRPDPPGVVGKPGGDRLKPVIQTQEIVSRASEPGPLRLFFLGNLIPRKGCLTLIEALRRMVNLDWELNVVGSLEMDRPYADKVRRKAQEGSLTERIRFKGPLVDRQLAGEMARHHLMVLPSFYEGYGIAYIEAMGFGMPVIGTNAGAAAEIITDGEDGFLVPPGDPISLAHVLDGLVEDRDRLARMGVSARQRYLRHPTWRDTMNKIRLFLKDVLNGRAQLSAD